MAVSNTGGARLCRLRGAALAGDEQEFLRLICEAEHPTTGCHRAFLSQQSCDISKNLGAGHTDVGLSGT